MFRQRTSGLAIAAVLAASAAASGAMAQDQATATDTAAELEEIVVTGSRIRRARGVSGQPIVDLGSEDIDKAGLVSVGDFLQQLPQSGGTFNARFNNSGNFGAPPDGGGIGAGSTQADLRFLGPKRVLVLVDGQRWVPESSGTGVSEGVDLNTVPTSAISRIEVLQDGASPIYGSDAIAGVVNIITRLDQEGLQASAYGGMFLNRGDGETQNYTISYGVQGERTRMFFNVEYNRTSRVSAADRKISAFPTPGVGACTPFCSSGTPQGRFIFTVPGSGVEADITLNNGAVNDIGNLASFNPLDPGNGDDFNPFDVSDRFNFSQFNLVGTPNKRIGFFANMEHDLTDRVKFVLKGVFNNRESTNQAAPEPLFIGPDAGNGSGSILDRISVDATNPFNPFGFTLSAFDDPTTPENDQNFVFAGRRPIEAGPRIFEQNVDTWYVNGGLVGDFEFADRSFFWDVHVTFSESQADQTKFGGFNAAKLEQALGPIDRCTAPCVPFNFFGGQGADGSGSITQEQLDFVTFIQQDTSQNELFDVNFNISGELFDLPAGTVGFAAGYEHREREGFFRPDAVVTAGESAGVPASPTQGKFNLDEVYGEINLPLLAGLPAIELLEASFAVRYNDNSVTKESTTVKAGVTWQVRRDLTLRASFSEGFRAPGIGELFGTGNRFDALLEDPCSDMLGLAGGQRQSDAIIANCVALGVPANGSFAQFNQQISTTVGGNRELQPETSNTWSGSMLYTPEWATRIPGVQSLSLETAVWSIDLENQIAPFDNQVKLTGCVETLDPLLCDGISRTAGGVINGFDNQLENIGGTETKGIDLTLDYASPETSFGQFRLRVLGSWLAKFKEEFPAADGGSLKISRVGTELGDPEKGFPEFQLNNTFDWSKGDFGVTFKLRYIDSLVEGCPANFFGTPAGGIADLSTLCSDPDNGLNKLGAKIVGDIQATWSPELYGRRFALTVGINNVTDTEPPPCLTCQLNGFDATLYDIPGQFGFVRLRVNL